MSTASRKYDFAASYQDPQITPIVRTLPCDNVRAKPKLSWALPPNDEPNLEVRNAKMSKLDMLTPENSAIALIDCQPAMYQGVQSHDRLVVFNNIQVLAKAAKLFKIPTVMSTVASDSFSGPFMPEVLEIFPNHKVIDRTSMNSWLDPAFRKAVPPIVGILQLIVRLIGLRAKDDHPG